MIDHLVFEHGGDLSQTLHRGSDFDEVIVRNLALISKPCGGVCVEGRGSERGCDFALALRRASSKPIGSWIRKPCDVPCPGALAVGSGCH